MSRVAIYARFSTSMQRAESIEDQVRLCVERAGREGWSLAQTYSDMAISGAGTPASRWNRSTRRSRQS